METDEAQVWLLLDSRESGGIESHVLALAMGLKAAGHRVQVVLLANHGPHIIHGALAERGIPARALPGSFKGLIAALRDAQPAILHTHGYKAGILGRLAARLCGIAAVSTFHAGEPGRGRVRLYNAIDRATAGLGWSVAVNRQIARQLPVDTTVINNFVTIPDEAELGLLGRPGPVAFVGRLAEEKGPDLFCQVAECLPEIEFEVYGDGPMRPALERRYGGKVVFRGAVDGMHEHWRRLGLLCMSSRHEGLPMAALEAMAHAVPVAAFAVGGLPDIIEEEVTGFLAPPADVESLAGIVARWHGMTVTDRAAIARRARDLVIDEYSVADGVSQILSLYHRVLSWPLVPAPALS